MTVEQVIPGVVGGLIGGVLTFAAVWLRGYLTEKGKNFATREDIQRITRLVEGVKGEMQALRDSQSRVRTTRHEALFAFAEPCLEILVQRLPAKLGEFPMDEGKSLFEHQQAMLALCTRIQVAYLRLEILMPHGHPLILAALAVEQSAPDLAKAVRNTGVPPVSRTGWGYRFDRATAVLSSYCTGDA